MKHQKSMDKKQNLDKDIKMQYPNTNKLAGWFLYILYSSFELFPGWKGSEDSKYILVNFQFRIPVKF